MRKPRTAVIGAGPAGCVAAYELARAGAPVILYEEQPSPGGRTASWHYAGATIDTGAGFLTSGDRTTRGYLRELDLEHRLEKVPDRVSFVSDRRRATLRVGTARGFIGFPFSSWREKLRLVFRLAGYAVRYRGLDYSDSSTLIGLDDRSIAERALEDLGENLYHHFVRPTFRALLYCDCGELSQAVMLAMYARSFSTRPMSLRGGLDSLCVGLSQAVRLRTLRRVVGLRRREDDRIVVSSSHPDGGAFEEEVVDQVVVATTADRALALCQELHPSLLPSGQKSFLASQRYEANVHCVYRVPWPDELALSGVIPVGPGEPDVAAIGIHPLWEGEGDGSSRLSAGYRLVSVYLSGSRSLELMDVGGPIEEECWAAARDLDSTLPREAEPVARFLRRAAIPLPSVGRFRLAHGFTREQRPPIVFAGDYLASPCIEAAVRAGRDAAALLLASG